MQNAYNNFQNFIEEMSTFDLIALGNKIQIHLFSNFTLRNYGSGDSVAHWGTFIQSCNSGIKMTSNFNSEKK